MRPRFFRGVFVFALALLTGVGFSVAAKRMELDDRLAALGDADAAQGGSGVKLAQWLNGQPTPPPWSNWPNY
jgi:hypothetical protein